MKLRKTSPEILRKYNIPILVDRSESVILGRGMTRLSLGTTVTQVAHFWLNHGRPNNTTKNYIGVVSGTSLARLLQNAKSFPTRTRGLAQDPCFSQIRSLSRLCDEIEANCWLFSLKTGGPAKSWSFIQSKKIEIDPTIPAKRTHYLDWKNPNHDGTPAKRVWEGK